VKLHIVKDRGNLSMDDGGRAWLAEFVREIVSSDEGRISVDAAESYDIDATLRQYCHDIEKNIMPKGWTLTVPDIVRHEMRKAWQDFGLQETDPDTRRMYYANLVMCVRGPNAYLVGFNIAGHNPALDVREQGGMSRIYYNMRNFALTKNEIARACFDAPAASIDPPALRSTTALSGHGAAYLRHAL
jgi:hypothetical protein